VFEAYLQAIGDLDGADHQHLAVLADVAHDLRDEVALLQFDAARFQRSGKRAGQSTASGGDDVVESGRVGSESLRVDPIVGGDLGVHAKDDRIDLRRQPGVAYRSFETLDPYAGRVDGLITHRSLRRLVVRQ
jgi:hypothetical protein